jgi:hypothetical protein
MVFMCPETWSPMRPSAKGTNKAAEPRRRHTIHGVTSRMDEVAIDSGASDRAPRPETAAPSTSRDVPMSPLPNRPLFAFERPVSPRLAASRNDHHTTTGADRMSGTRKAAEGALVASSASVTTVRMTSSQAALASARFSGVSREIYP